MPTRHRILVTALLSLGVLCWQACAHRNTHWDTDPLPTRRSAEIRCNFASVGVANPNFDRMVANSAPSARATTTEVLVLIDTFPAGLTLHGDQLSVESPDDFAVVGQFACHWRMGGRAEVRAVDATLERLRGLAKAVGANLVIAGYVRSSVPGMVGGATGWVVKAKARDGPPTPQTEGKGAQRL